MNPSKHGGRPGLIRMLCAVFLIALAFSIYYNSLEGDFVYDDNQQIVENPWVTSYKYLPLVFSTHSFGFVMDKKQGTTYRPMVFAVYIAEYAMFGLKPWGWHLMNVIFHAANGVMVFFVLMRLLESFMGRATGTDPPLARYLPPMAGAIIFTVHTLNNEVVAWVGCVPELVYTLLSLAALYLHMRAVDGRWASRVVLTFFSVVLFFVAMFTKETAIALPAFVFVYEALRRKEGLFARLLKSLPATLPYMGALAIYFAIRISALGGMVPRGNMYPFLNGYQYLINGMVLFVKYMRALVLPVGLYPFQILDPVFSATEPRAVGAAIALALAAALLYIFRKRLPPIFFLAVAFIVIPLLPALYIPGISRHTFADRYLYFSTIGYGLIVAMALKGLAMMALQKRSFTALWAATAVFVLAAGLYSVGAINRNATWKNNLTLWRQSEKGSADNYVARFQLASALANDGRLLEAIVKFKQAIEIASSNPHPDPWIIGTAHINLAQLYSTTGQSGEAASQYREILNSYPTHPEANFELGIILQAEGRYDEAIEHYRTAAKTFKNPSDIKDALTNTGNCYYKKGLFKEALSSYEEALRYSPNDPAVLNNMRVLQRRMGR